MVFCFYLWQGKLQKHQAFEAEVQANATAIIKLDEFGNKMITNEHFATEIIRVSGFSVVWFHVFVLLIRNVIFIVNL